MTLTFELDLYRVKMNQRATCLGQRSLGSKLLSEHAYRRLIPTDCSTFTHKVVSKYVTPVSNY